MTEHDKTDAQASAPSTALDAPAEMTKPLVSNASTPQPIGDDEKAPTSRAVEFSEQHSDFSADVHQYVRDFITAADQKAAFFFAGATAVLAFLHSRSVSAKWFKDVRSWSLTDGLSFIATFGLAASAAVLLFVVFPRLGGSRRGIIFFKTVAKFSSSAEYADDVLRRSGLDIVRTRLEHTHELSQVCFAKYRVLRIGFWVGTVGMFATLAYFALAPAA